MKKRLLLGVSLCVSLTVTAFADSHVTVYSPDRTKTIRIDGAKDLAELVTHPEVFSHTWWPATVIAEKQATFRQQSKKQQVLAQLTGLANYYRQNNDDDLAQSAEALHQQLSAINVTGRQFVTLDPDLVRVTPQDNRQLEGDYALYTARRPSTVTVLGLLTPAGKQSLKIGEDVSEYLDDHQRLAGGDRNNAWLIQPDSQSEEVPIAYWNKRHHEAAPGSTIFVGFSSYSLPEAYRNINVQIVALLTNRIPD